MTCNQFSYVLIRTDIFENYFKEKFLNFDHFRLRKCPKNYLELLFLKEKSLFFVLTTSIKRCLNKSTLLIKTLRKT